MEIKTIVLGGVVANCYLIKTDIGFILIDTGRESKRKILEKELFSAGCNIGNLNLIILTHGDFDHTGNGVYLRNKYGTKIAMHYDDSGMVEYGDMFWNRKTGNYIAKKMINSLFRIPKFIPDFTIDEGHDLSEYGLDAKILYIPGHSKGSVGILTVNGEFFCGDLFVNIKVPSLNTIIDNQEEARASVEKLKSYNINKVYPGHGKPFAMSSITF